MQTTAHQVSPYQIAQGQGIAAICDPLPAPNRSDGEGLVARCHLLGPLGVTPIPASEVEAMIDGGGAELRRRIDWKPRVPRCLFSVRAVENAWRDIVVVPAGGRAKVRTQYLDYTGKTFYHCHILDHEDLGMMAVLGISS